MNGDLIPAVAAATTGSALISSIWAYERHRDEKMRASRVRLGLRFPASLDPLAAKAVLGSLSGLPVEAELMFETAADGDGIRFFVSVPAGLRASVVSTFAGAMPGLRVSEAPIHSGRATCVLRIFIPTPSVLVTEHPEAASRTLLSALATLSPQETVIIRWAVRPSSAPALHTDQPPDAKARARVQAWRQKTQVGGGFQLSGLVLVHADRIGRARELAEHVASAIRSRRGGIGGPRITYERGNRSLGSFPRTTHSSGWLNAGEVLPLLSWPLGDELIPGVEVGVSRELLVPRSVPMSGRRLFIGRSSQGEREVALSPTAALHHVAVVGPSGVGKSVLLARGILDDIEAGYGGVAIDPKADLVDAVLRRVKPEHADRIAVLDPAEPRVPGVAVLAGGDPDLRAEVLTNAIRSAFPAEAWGVRTDFFLRLAIRTLAGVPQTTTLADIGRLFFDEPFRQQAVARVRDPFIASAWQSYAMLSGGSQAEHVQAPMARIMALLSRPKVRAIIANPDPKLDIARLLAERKFLLVSLAPGVLGESGASTVGAVLMYVIWSAVEGRVALPPAKRHPVFVHVDELATVTNGLPFSFELLAERARGLGAGLTVAMQTLGRIPEPTRSAIVGNVASFITWRAGAEEAQRLARQLPGLTDKDLMALGRFEVAARIGTGLGSAVTVVTGRTEPLPPETGQAAAIRNHSSKLYGSDPDARQASPSAASTPDDRPLGRGGRST
jgi:hypothetical protein